jgi:hypothetical protein
MLALLFLLWALSAFAETEAEVFSLGENTYARLVVPPGGGAAEQRLREIAFEFALDELVRRGSITPEMRVPIRRTESPDAGSGYILVVKCARTDGPWQLGEIQGVIRADIGSLRFIGRLNALREGKEPLEASALVGSFFARSLRASKSPLVVEPKNFVLRGGIGIAPLLIHSLFEKIIPEATDAAFLETNLGTLSEYYVRFVGGFSYQRIYDESTGAEVAVPQAWARGADGPTRMANIRSILGPERRKHVAVLAADRLGLSVIRGRAALDPLVVGFRASAVPLSSSAAAVEAFLSLHPPKCGVSFGALDAPH